MVQTAWWNHLVLASGDCPDVIGNVLEHKPHRTLLDDQPTPNPVGDRMHPAQPFRNAVFIERWRRPLHGEAFRKLRVQFRLHLSIVPRSET